MAGWLGSLWGARGRRGLFLSGGNPLGIVRPYGEYVGPFASSVALGGDPAGGGLGLQLLEGEGEELQGERGGGGGVSDSIY